MLWLTGVDYFSTLGYQPGIALLAAGALAVPATAVLIVVTLLGAVPIYAAVAKRSYAGQGSIALLENLFSGWTSKIIVLVLLGFAATDFVITMTLSAADAARHAIANPYLHPFAGDSQMRVTLILLLLLAIVFSRDFGGHPRRLHRRGSLPCAEPDCAAVVRLEDCLSSGIAFRLACCSDHARRLDGRLHRVGSDLSEAGARPQRI